MSLKVTDTFKRAPQVQSQEVAYPALFHFRVIVEASVAEVPAALRVALAAYTVAAPLTASRASSGGRYQAYSVSVEIRSRDELHAFDAAIKAVPGVRMLL